MANGTLPNPSFGNDPATLLGSLIVEIGELAQLQKDTTARIENLDENEDRSTTLIEHAIRDDIEEGIKRTDTLKDLTKGTLQGINDIRKVTDEEREFARNDYNARLDSYNAIQQMRSDMTFSAKASYHAGEAMREIKHFFDPTNEQGMKKVFNDVVDGIGNAFTRGATSGTNQLKRGFENLTDGMGALGPVVNAFKTGLNKAGAVVDIAVGSFRAVGQAFSATKSMLGGFFGVDRPENELEQALQSGDAVMSEDEANEMGGSKNPMFVDFTGSALDSLRKVIHSMNYESATIPGMEKTKDGLFVPKGTKKEMAEQRKFRNESLKNIKEEKRYRGGIPRFAIYLGGLILIIASILFALKNFFTNPIEFFKNSGAAAAGGVRSIFGLGRNLDPKKPFQQPVALRNQDPGSKITDLERTQRIQNIEGQRTATYSIGRPRNAPFDPDRPTTAPGNTLSVKRMLLPERLQKVTVSESLRGKLNPENIKMSDIVDSKGNLTPRAQKMPMSDRLKVIGVQSLRRLPKILAGADALFTIADYRMAMFELDTLYESGKAITTSAGGPASPLTQAEYENLRAAIESRLVGQGVGIYSGYKVAMKVGARSAPSILAFGGPQSNFNPFVLTAKGLTILGTSFAAGYAADSIASNIAERGTRLVLLDTTARFSDPNLSDIYIADINTSGEIEGVADDIVSAEVSGTGVGVVAPEMNVIAPTENQNIIFDKSAPAEDAFLNKSQNERASYMGIR